MRCDVRRHLPFERLVDPDVSEFSSLAESGSELSITSRSAKMKLLLPTRFSPTINTLAASGTTSSAKFRKLTILTLRCIVRNGSFVSPRGSVRVSANRYSILFEE